VSSYLVLIGKEPLEAELEYRTVVGTPLEAPIHEPALGVLEWGQHELGTTQVETTTLLSLNNRQTSSASSLRLVWQHRLLRLSFLLLCKGTSYL